MADVKVEPAPPAEGRTRSDVGDRELLARFVAERDDAAFAEIVRRHGRTVWNVCRRVLREVHAAEDAFQATFLVLARRAAGIRQGEAVGSWLYGVAYRTAMAARRNADRRRQRESRAAAGSPEPAPQATAACRELHEMLDDEVQRLPAKLRAPFVLCCIQGLSRPEAAAELGWREGTVSSRIAQARKVLQGRLARRGVTLSAVLTAVTLTDAAVPAALAQTTLHATVAGAAVSPQALALADQVLRPALLAILPTGLGVFLPLVILVVGLAAQRAPAPVRPAPAVAAPELVLEPRHFTTRSIPIVPAGPAPVLALAIAPDGGTVAVATAETVRLYDPASSKLQRELAGSSGTTNALAFGPDGRTLAGGGDDHRVRLWDPAAGRLLRTLAGHTGPVRAVVITPDNSRLISTGDDGSIKVWDAQSGRELRSLNGHEGPVRALAVTPRGRHLASGGDDGRVRVWDLAADTAPLVLEGHVAPVRGLLALDDEVVESAGADRTLRVWSFADGAQRLVRKGLGGPLALNASGRTLVAGGDAGDLHFGEPGGFDRMGFRGHKGAVRALAFDPRGGSLLSGGADGAVFRWKGDPSWSLSAAGLRALPESGLLLDFRKGRGPRLPAELLEPTSTVAFRPEDAGLRITLPAGRSHGNAIGVVLNLPVAGDFDVRAGFEILTADVPTDGHGLGVELYVTTGSPRNEGLGIARVVRVQEGESIVVSRNATEAGARRFQTLPYPAGPARSGMLRLTRTGSEATCWVAEGPDGTFREVRRFDLGTEDLTSIRIAAYPGTNRKTPLDIRIHDLSVRRLGAPPPVAIPAPRVAVAPVAEPQSVPAPPVTSRPAAAQAPVAAASQNWLLRLIVIDGLLASAAVAGCIGFMRRRRAQRAAGAANQ